MKKLLIGTELLISLMFVAWFVVVTSDIARMAFI